MTTLQPAPSPQRRRARWWIGDWAVLPRISRRRALRHIEALAGQIGPRIGGTPSEHRARDYIAAELRALRYVVTLQPFPVPNKHIGTISPDPHTTWQAPAAPNGPVTSSNLDIIVGGELVDVDTGHPDTFPADVAGKIVLFVNAEPGDAPTQLAIERGARAVLLGRVSPTPDRKMPAFTPALTTSVTVPVLGLAQYHVEQLRERLKNGTASVQVTTTRHTNLVSYNVIAERPATFPLPDSNVILLSAHYDSVIGAPGANDDASGVALCLELARVLRRLPTRRAVRICLWGSEEQGLLGSHHYVQQLADDDASRILAVLQNDMVATSHKFSNTYWMLAVDGADNASTLAVEAAAARLGYHHVRGPVVRGGSDHVSFHERGIAAANYSWRREPAVLEPVYHTPEDTIAANISLDRLEQSMRVIGSAAYELAARRDPHIL